MLSTTLGFFPLSKSVTIPFKPVYECHGSQQGIFFHFSSKVPQLSLNLTNVVNNDGFWIL